MPDLPKPLPRRDIWARIGPLHAALRRVAPVLTVSQCLGEVPATGPDPYLWVTYQQLGPYKIHWRAIHYEWTTGQWAGAPVCADPETAARQIAERMGAPVHTP